MDHQDAEKVACSSDDLIRSVARNLKFYAEIKRREDGFDLSPSGIPRMLFPNLLPRPMLQSALKDISLKHHFSHAQVRCALAKIQSSKFPSPNLMSSPREKQIWKLFRKTFNGSKFDHPMMPANHDYTQPLLLGLGSRKKVKVLRDGLKQLRRAPPPHLKSTEEERLVDASWRILREVESCPNVGPEKSMEMGNTKLQSLHRSQSMQKSFMAAIHAPYIPAPPPMDKIVRPRQPRFIYDCHGRRHKVILVEN